MRCFNPVAFRPWQVTFWTTLVYAALLVPLVWVHESVPPAPQGGAPYEGVSIDAAWADLTKITRSYHPYNTRANDDVRSYLLKRIRNILDGNDVNWMVHSDDTNSKRPTGDPSVVVFDDNVSNVTVVTGVAGGSTRSDTPCASGSYFEGTNVIVYIRGTNDPPGEWWKPGSEALASSNGGVLVNAHYDSVASGYGATDDGVGVVTVLQLISYFTTPGRQPRFGILALLNNGEEDFLWGARAFGQSPLMPFVHTFLNLEGAGAGGRAMLFRSTDREVTATYGASPHPFGSVVAADGFALGLIRSQTDYVVLRDAYGQRGLDLAFYEPRARYHTDQDDARHTSRASLWHMLSASVRTMDGLTDSMAAFSGPRRDGDEDKVQNGKPTAGVYFDLFGSALAVFALKGLFAWSLTLVVTGPIILMLVSYVLYRFDRYYFFAGRVSVHAHMEDDPISIRGHYGFFRFPIAFTFATGMVVGSAFLVTKLNPLIICSSSYAVFAMMLSLWYFVFWVIMSGFDYHRPSALHRSYAVAWLYSLSWVVVVGVLVLESRFQIASGYPFVIFHSGLFLAMLITLVEMAFLPSKLAWAEWVHDVHQVRESVEPVLVRADERLPSGGSVGSSSGDDDDGDGDDGQNSAGRHRDPDETTPLVGGGGGGSDWDRTRNQWVAQGRISFATRFRRSISEIVNGPGKDMDPQYGQEQRWSGPMPSSLWILQFLLTAPMAVVTLGQVGLFIMTATSGVGADGGADHLFFPYAVAAAFSVLVLVPAAPFVHRVRFHVPVVLLAVFAGTLAYLLLAFPFSPQNRYKLYFRQLVDLDAGQSTVHLDGIERFVRRVTDELPSAAGRDVTCETVARAPGIVSCSFNGSEVMPHLGGGGVLVLVDEEEEEEEKATQTKKLKDLVTINVTRPDSSVAKATLEIDAVDTRACYLLFDGHITSFAVRHASPLDERFGKREDVCRVNLFRRDWDKAWKVDIEWDPDSISHATTSEEEEEHEDMRDLNTVASTDADGELKMRRADDDDDAATATAASEASKKRSSALTGKVICHWSDANVQGTIPAFDEALKYAPAWVALTKSGPGLVEGSKAFTV